MWEWSFSSDLYTGNGTLETDSTTVTLFGFTGYPIVSITGTWDGDAITGLLPFNTVGSNDNLLGNSIQLLSTFGMAFLSAADGPVNIFHNGLTFYRGTSVAGGSDNGLGTFLATESAAPEPATAILIIPTLLGLALFVRHRKRRLSTMHPARRFLDMMLPRRAEV